ncbi:hypothetical protein GCM10027262_18230 [Nocardia tengchongensis]
MVAGEIDVAVGHGDEGGASGYVAGHVIQELLGQGYRLRGTVRSAARAADVAALLPGVELVEADLGADAGWDAAVTRKSNWP